MKGVKILVIFLLFLLVKSLNITWTPSYKSFSRNYYYSLTELLKLSNFALPSIKIYIGTPLVPWTVGISTSHSISWLASSTVKSFFKYSFEKDKSQTFEFIPKEAYSFTYQRDLYLLKPALDFINIINTQLYLLNKENVFPRHKFILLEKLKDYRSTHLYNNLGGELSFYNYNERTSSMYESSNTRKTNSFVAYLKNIRHIQNDSIMGIDYNSKKGGNIIWDQNYSYNKDTVSCTADYGCCQVYRIMIDVPEKSELKARSTYNWCFDINEPFIYAPLETIDFIYKKFIEVSEGSCEVKNDDVNLMTYLICNTNKWPDIHINLLGSNPLVLKAESYFAKNDENKYIYLLVQNKNKANSWTMGLPFFDRNVIWFDVQMGQIVFFEKSDLEENKGDEYTNLKTTMKFIIQLNMVLIILNSFFIFNAKYQMMTRVKY